MAEKNNGTSATTLEVLAEQGHNLQAESRLLTRRQEAYNKIASKENKKKQSHRPKSSICKMLAISDRMAGCYVHVDGHRDDRDDERGALDNQ